MKRLLTAKLFIISAVFLTLAACAMTNPPGHQITAPAPAASHGIAYPKGWQNWAAISVSQRTDNNSLRLIVGNTVAIEAARSGKTNPWPEGTIIGKIVWKQGPHENWPAALAPKQFVHAEFMFKDNKKYAKTHGWGWARWVGASQKPFQKGPHVCIACHTPVKDRDWFFTEPAFFPQQGH